MALDRGGVLWLCGTQWLCSGFTTLWRTRGSSRRCLDGDGLLRWSRGLSTLSRARVSRRHGRDRGGLPRLLGTHLRGRGLGTLWRALVSRRHGRDRGGFLRLGGTHCWCRGLGTLWRARVHRRHGRAGADCCGSGARNDGGCAEGCGGIMTKSTPTGGGWGVACGGAEGGAPLSAGASAGTGAGCGASGAREAGDGGGAVAFGG